jgi:hypothetical protein
MKLGFSYTAHDDDALSIAIRKATGGVAHHVLARVEENDGSLIYFESSWSKDASTGKDGVRGPLPYAKLLQWAAGSPKHKVIEQDWLPLTEEEIVKAIQMLTWATRTIKYAHLQLATNLLQNMGVILAVTSFADLWTCSETCARILSYRISAPYLKLGDCLFNNIVPSAKGDVCGLYEAMERVIADAKIGTLKS